jgi:hypothetical protein
MNTVRKSVLAFVSDYGVESKLHTMPRIQITQAWMRAVVLREHPKLLKYITVDSDIPVLMRSSSDFFASASQSSEQTGDLEHDVADSDVLADSEWVNRFFPNAFYIAGPKHGMANLSQDSFVGGLCVGCIGFVGGLPNYVI